MVTVIKKCFYSFLRLSSLKSKTDHILEGNLMAFDVIVAITPEKAAVDSLYGN